MRTRIVWAIFGFVLGVLTINALAQNRALPAYLMYGRTSLGINHPVLIDSSGVVQTHNIP
jgi:hypothetical protein